MLVQGYHPGLEDDAFYLAAIKHNLNPALFPHDAEFFRVQFHAIVFDKLIALYLRWTHVPLEWGIIFSQCSVNIMILLVYRCHRMLCFATRHSTWVGRK